MEIEVTPSINALNKRLSYHNKSGYTGIAITENGKYESRVKINGEIHYFGRFADIKDAVKAREDFLTDII